MTTAQTIQRRLAAGLLATLFGGAALMGGTPAAAADDLHAGEIVQTSQFDTTSGQFDTNDDRGSDSNTNPATLPLQVVTNAPVAAAYLPTPLDHSSSVQGANVDDGPAPATADQGI